MALDEYTETEGHPLSFVGQVRREVAGRVMTDYERRLRDRHGQCGVCGGPYDDEGRPMASPSESGLWFIAHDKRCQWCGLRP